MSRDSDDDSEQASLHAQTRMISHGFDPASVQGSVKPPIYLTSTFAFPSAEDGARFFDVAAGRVAATAGQAAGYVYSRFAHPNLVLAEQRLAVLDGNEAALITASGMAAVGAALLALLAPGDQVVQSMPVYGGTQTLLDGYFSKLGVGVEAFSDGLSRADMQAALERAAARGPVRVCYVETPSNPLNTLVDLDALRRALDTFEARHGYRPVSICDNTFAGPIFQQPGRHGVDLSAYSLTKYVGGHSDLVAGGLTGTSELIERIHATRSAFGMQLDPHSCWMLTRSMETVVLRMEQAARSASAVAHWLAQSPHGPLRVHHPELETGADYQAAYQRQCTAAGSTFSVELPGGRAQAFAFINGLRRFKSAVSLGGTESLVCHPASTTHSGVPPAQREAAGVTEGLVRLSIGLEHPDDLVADLGRALRACA